MGAHCNSIKLLPADGLELGQQPSSIHHCPCINQSITLEEIDFKKMNGVFIDTMVLQVFEAQEEDYRNAAGRNSAQAEDEPRRNVSETSINDEDLDVDHNQKQNV